MSNKHVTHLQRMANESWRGSPEHAALTAAIAALSAQQPPADDSEQFQRGWQAGMLAGRDSVQPAAVDEAMLRDAERYRWLRDCDDGNIAAFYIDAAGAPDPTSMLAGSQLDDDIDAAREAEIEQANRQRDLAQQGWQDAEDSNAELHAEIEVLRAEVEQLMDMARMQAARADAAEREARHHSTRAEQLMEVLQGVVDALGPKLHTTSDGRVYLPEHETKVAFAAAQDILNEYKK